MKVSNHKSLQCFKKMIVKLYNFKEKNMTYIKWGVFLVWFIMTLYKSYNQVPTVVYENNNYYMNCDSIPFAIFQ